MKLSTSTIVLAGLAVARAAAAQGPASRVPHHAGGPARGRCPGRRDARMEGFMVTRTLAVVLAVAPVAGLLISGCGANGDTMSPAPGVECTRNLDQDKTYCDDPDAPEAWDCTGWSPSAAQKAGCVFFEDQPTPPGNVYCC